MEKLTNLYRKILEAIKSFDIKKICKRGYLSKDEWQNNRKVKMAALVFIAVLIVALILPSKDKFRAYRIYKGSGWKVHRMESDRKTNYIINVSSIGTEIHPYGKTGRYGAMIKDLVYEPLASESEDGKMRYVLAKDIKVADDGKRLEIKLRRGKKFQDGDKVNAKAVKKAYMWHMNQGNASDYYGLCQNIKKVRAVSEYKLEILIGSDVRVMKDIVQVPLMHVSKEKASKNEPFDGSGKYEIQKIVPMDRVVLTPVHSGKYAELTLQEGEGESISDTIKNQSSDYFAFSGYAFLKKLKKEKAYDVYEKQRPEGVYIALDGIRDIDKRRAVATVFDTKKIYDEVNDHETGIYSKGAANAYSRKALAKRVKKSKGLPNRLSFGHGSSGTEMHIYSEARKQLKEAKIKYVEEIYTDGNAGETANVYIYRGRYQDLLSKKEMREFGKRLNGKHMTDYDEVFDKYVADQCLALPLYREKLWIASIHGRNPSRILSSLY